jgi:flagellar biogenesis protein FliO
MIINTVEGKCFRFIIFCLAAFFFMFIFVLCPINAKDKPFNDKSVSESAGNDADKSISAGADKSATVQENQYDYEKPTVEEESYIWLIFKTIIVLGILIGGFYFFYKFVTKKTGMQLLGRDVIKVLSVVPVGQNKFLQVIDLAGRIMVIGVSDSSINLITEVLDRNEIDRIRLLSSKSSPIHPGGFQDYIAKYIARFFKKDGGGNIGTGFEIRHQENEQPATDKMNYLKKQRERLKKINGNDDEI